MSDLQVRLYPVTDFPRLAARWRALEAQCELSFFQSWTWVGCLAEERYTNPMLLVASRDNQDVGLALFNRHTMGFGLQTLHLNETGNAHFDSMFVEHNGILHLPQAEADLNLCLNKLLSIAPNTRLMLSGVDITILNAARASGHVVRLSRTEPSPYVDYNSLPPGESGFHSILSANTRYQLRRSDRLYSQRGSLQIRRATSVNEACTMLGALAVLHQRTWTARGHSGAFANPKFIRFHRALIARAWPSGEIDILEISAGHTVIGYLYNFCHRGKVLTYQSGFDYASATAHEKPGVTSHHLAIKHYQERGYSRYDFLAGEDRYKSSLSNASTSLYWIDLVPQHSFRGIATRIWRKAINAHYANIDTRFHD